MAAPSDPYDFIKRSLDQHFELYMAFTRLILSLAAGSLSLLVALGSDALAGAHAPWPIALVFGLLCVSVLAGVLVQYRIVERPRRYIDQLVDRSDAAAPGDEATPVLLRKVPTFVERAAFEVQVSSFVTAFVLLAAHGVLRGVWP